MRYGRTIAILGLCALWFIFAFALGSTFRTEPPMPTPIVYVTPTATPECQTNMFHWTDDIARWSDMYGIPEDLLYAIMLQESGGMWCIQGEPVYWRGDYIQAQGLFQVMPFHFDEGEDMLDPDTNALRASERILECMRLVTRYNNLGWEHDESIRNTAACYLGRGIFETPYEEDVGKMRPHCEWSDAYKRYAGNVLSIYQHRQNR